MPSHMPSSFASAAAGQSSNRDSRSGRGDGRGSNDWPRNSRPTNGTLTLRRSSTTPYGQPSQADSTIGAHSADTQESQAQANVAYEPSTDSRYSKNSLLDLLKAQQSPDATSRDVSSLFINQWEPGHSNGTNGRGWGKSHDSRDTHGPDVCWDANGSVQPISLEEMTESDRNLFSGDVNSPLKPPPQNSNKDPNAQGLGSNGRKSSISHGQPSGSFGVSSPASSSRPSTRRQQTSDSITGLGSPAGSGRFFREEPSPFLSRKLTDLKDASDDRADDAKGSSPFGNLIRSNTAGSVLGNGPASPWGAAPTSATMSPMGNFGSFSIPGASTNQTTPSEKRPAYGSMRGESRLAHLMPKDSSEDISSKAAERSWRSRPRTDTDPFGDETPTGSAALGGGQDNSPPLNSQRRAPGLDTPVRGISGDFGMSDIPGFRDSLQRQSHQTPQGQHGEREHEPMSPSDTNPFRSPPEDRNDRDDDSYDGEMLQHGRAQGLGGIPEHGPNPFGNLPRAFSGAPAFDGSDRSQTSSAGASKGFSTLGGLPSLSGLGGMGGWPTSGNPIGTPDRENRPGFPGAFGNSIFGPMGDLQSPSVSGLGGIFGPSGNTIGRGSKLGSLFPAAMQAQMQGAESDNTLDGGEMRQSSAFGAIGRNAFPPSRDTDSPMRAGRGGFDDMFAQAESSRNQGPFSSSEATQGQTTTSFPQSSSTQNNYQQSQASSDSASNQLPTAQQRMMVMPDRMRWVYLDPHGQVQGPWSGLEMHDWYKASFFTPDLSVRKLEDTEFEPLGQLIRRIGNSREPFLVPQIGIPHGPPSTQAGTPFTPAAAAPGSGAQPGSVLPPFAGAFPSFGTTLTAEQQNNLERRKQEEQYLMARQREFLAQQQVNMKQMQMTGLPASLHHQGSAGSLHSQPSFGSMTSPMGLPQQASIPGVSGFFDGARQPPTQAAGGMPPDFFREDELARLSLQERQELFGATAPGSQGAHTHQVNAIFGQQPDAQREAARLEQLRQNDPQGFKARLREFEQLRAQHEIEEGDQSSANVTSEPISTPHQSHEPEKKERNEERKPEASEVLSLTQQVQKAASAKQSPISALQPESPWGKVNTGLPMPFPPPPQSTTPLPAPTAQRGRTNLPEALNVGIRSRSETPEVAAATPSIAPWAKEPAEATKGPSLKEIQEMEAKKAAVRDEQAANARRIALEQEMKQLSSQPVALAPGLPTTSTWGNSASPATPSASSVWANSSAAAAKNAAASKKTLNDILKEEERKKQLATAATATQSPTTTSGGKRYAELASKPTASAPAPAFAGSWSTVGAGGKVKIPTGPAAAIPQAVRASSSATIPTTAARAARPAPAVRSVTTSGQPGGTTAKDEFNKWAKGALSKGLDSNVDVDNFLSMISGFPMEVIADSVYSSSKLMDGRHFAEEFIRRRKLADKGIVEPSTSGSGTGFPTSGEKSGGWSEVAKKGPPKEEPTTGFKVVPNKKKGKK